MAELVLNQRSPWERFPETFCGGSFISSNDLHVFWVLVHLGTIQFVLLWFSVICVLLGLFVVLRMLWPLFSANVFL